MSLKSNTPNSIFIYLLAWSSLINHAFCQNSWSDWADWTECQAVTDLANESELFLDSINRDFMYSNGVDDVVPTCTQGYRSRKRTCFSYQAKAPDYDELAVNQTLVDLVNTWKNPDITIGEFNEYQNSDLSQLLTDWDIDFEAERIEYEAEAGNFNGWDKDNFAEHPCWHDPESQEASEANLKYAFVTTGGRIEVNRITDVLAFIPQGANFEWTGDEEELEQCLYPCQPKWSSWGEWSLCRQGCDGGWSRRDRNCESAFERDCQDAMLVDSHIVGKNLDDGTLKEANICQINSDVTDNFATDYTDFTLEQSKNKYEELRKLKYGNNYYILDPDGEFYSEFDPCNDINKNQDQRQYFYGYYTWIEERSETGFVDMSEEACRDSTTNLYQKHAKVAEFDALLDCNIANYYTPFPSNNAGKWIEDMKTESTSDITTSNQASTVSQRYVKKYNYDYRICNYKKCDEDQFEWSEWSAQTECSVNCIPCTWRNDIDIKECDYNAAYKLYYRMCRRIGQSPDDLTEYTQCPDDPVTKWGNYKKDNCFDDNDGNGVPECVFVKEWTKWEACTRTCGGGFRKRTRPCNHNMKKTCSKLKRVYTAQASRGDSDEAAQVRADAELDYESDCWDYTEEAVTQEQVEKRIEYIKYAEIFPFTENSCDSIEFEQTEPCALEQCYHEPMRSIELGMEFMLYTEEKDWANAQTDLISHGQIMAYFNEDSTIFLSLQEKYGLIDFGTMLWAPVKINNKPISYEEADRNKAATVEFEYQNNDNNVTTVNSLDTEGYNDIFMNFGFDCVEEEQLDANNATITVEVCKEREISFEELNNFKNTSRLCSAVVIEDTYKDKELIDEDIALGGITTFVNCEELHSYLGMRPIMHSVGSWIAGATTNFLYPLETKNKDRLSMPYIFGQVSHETALKLAEFDSRSLVHIDKDFLDEKQDRQIIGQLSHAMLRHPLYVAPSDRNLREGENDVTADETLDSVYDGVTFWIHDKWTTKMNEKKDGKYVNIAGSASDKVAGDRTIKDNGAGGFDKTVSFLPPDNVDAQLQQCANLNWKEVTPEDLEAEDFDESQFMPFRKTGMTEKEWNSIMKEHNKCCLKARGSRDQDSSQDVQFQLELTDCLRPEFPLVYEYDPLRFPSLLTNDVANSLNVTTDIIETTLDRETAIFYQRKSVTQAKSIRFLERAGGIPPVFWDEETFALTLDAVTDVRNFDHASKYDYSDRFREEAPTSAVQRKTYRYWLGMKLNLGTIIGNDFTKHSSQKGIDIYSWDDQSFNEWPYLQAKYNWTNTRADEEDKSLSVHILETLIPDWQTRFESARDSNKDIYKMNEILDADFFNQLQGSENWNIASTRFQNLRNLICLYIDVEYDDDSATPFSENLMDWKIGRSKCNQDTDKARVLGLFPSKKEGSINGLPLNWEASDNSEVRSQKEFKEKTGHSLTSGGTYRASYADEYQTVLDRNPEYGQRLQNSLDEKVPVTSFLPSESLFEAGFNMQLLNNEKEPFENYEDLLEFEETAHWIGFKYDHTSGMYYSAVEGWRLYYTFAELRDYINGPHKEYVKFDLTDIDGDCLLMGLDANETLPVIRSASCFSIKYRMIYDMQTPLATTVNSDEEKANFKVYWSPNRVNAETSRSWMARAWEDNQLPYSEVRFLGAFSNQKLLQIIYETGLQIQTDIILEDISDPEDDFEIFEHKIKESKPFWFNLKFDQDWLCQTKLVDGQEPICDPDTNDEDLAKRKFDYNQYSNAALIEPSERLTKPFFDGIEGSEGFSMVQLQKLLADLSPNKPCSIINAASTDEATQIFAGSCDPLELTAGQSFWNIRYMWQYIEMQENLRILVNKESDDVQSTIVTLDQVKTWNSNYIKFEHTDDGLQYHYPDRNFKCSVGEVDYNEEDDIYYINVRKMHCDHQICREDLVTFGNITESHMVCYDNQLEDDVREIWSNKPDTVAVDFGTSYDGLNTAASFVMTQDIPKEVNIDLNSENGEALSMFTMYTERTLEDAYMTVRDFNIGRTNEELIFNPKTASFLVAHTQKDWDDLATNIHNFPVDSRFWYGYKYNPDHRILYHIDFDEDKDLSSKEKLVRQPFGFYTSNENVDKDCTIYHVTGVNEAEIVAADCINEFASIAFGEFEVDYSDNSSDDELWYIPAEGNVDHYTIHTALVSGNSIFDSDLEARHHDAQMISGLFVNERKRRETQTDESNINDKKLVLLATQRNNDEMSIIKKWVEIQQIFPLPKGPDNDNLFWMGLKWDEDLRRFRYNSKAIQEEYVYHEQDLPWNEIEGLSYDADHWEYVLEDPTKHCILYNVTVSEVTLKMADCENDTAMTLAMVPRVVPYNLDRGLVWQLNTRVDEVNEDHQTFNSSTILIEPKPMSYNDMYQHMLDCVSANKPNTDCTDCTECLHYDAHRTHPFILEENFDSMFDYEFNLWRQNQELIEAGNTIDEYQIRLPTGYFLVGMIFNEDLQEWNYMEQNALIANDAATENYPVLDLHLLPLVFASDSENTQNCMVIHFEPDFSLDEEDNKEHMALHRVSCDAKYITDNDGLEWPIRMLSVVERFYTIPTVEASEICEQDNHFATGRISGDPHMKTFDGRYMSYQGKYSYILSELCISERENWNTIEIGGDEKSVNLTDHLPDFQIIGDFESYPNSNESTHLQSLRIIYTPVGDDTTYYYLLENDAETIFIRTDAYAEYEQVRSERVYEYPGGQDQLALTGSRNNFLLKFFNGNIIVHFYLKAATIELSCLFQKKSNSWELIHSLDHLELNTELDTTGQTKVCGLLGSFDKNNLNDLYMRGDTDEDPPEWVGSDEITVINYNSIGTSWCYNTTENANCNSDPPSETAIFDKCQSVLSTNIYVAIEQKCHNAIERIKKNYNSRDCFKFSSEHLYNCMSDLCSYRINGIITDLEILSETTEENLANELLCSVIGSIGEECVMGSSEGDSRPLDDWRKNEFEPCRLALKCPANSHYSSCVELEPLTVANCQSHRYEFSGSESAEDFTKDELAQLNINSLMNYDQLISEKEIENSRDCKEGCQCDLGYIFDGIRCIKIDTHDLPFCPEEIPAADLEPHCTSVDALLVGGNHIGTFNENYYGLTGECDSILSQYPCSYDDRTSLEPNFDQNVDLTQITPYELMVYRQTEITRREWSRKVTLKLLIPDRREATLSVDGLTRKISLTIGGVTQRRISSDDNLCEYGIIVRQFDKKGIRVFAGIQQEACNRLHETQRINEEPEIYHLNLVIAKKTILLRLNCIYSSDTCGLFDVYYKHRHNHPNGVVGSEINQEFINNFIHENGACKVLPGTPEDTVQYCTDKNSAEKINEFILRCREATFGKDNDGNYIGQFLDTDCCDGHTYSDECLVGPVKTNGLIGACVRDLCASSNAEEEKKILCETSSDFATACRLDGSSAINYISETCKADIICPENSEYRDEETSCQPSVGNCHREDSYCHHSTPIDGCFCSENYHWSEVAFRCISDTLCVHPDFCAIDNDYTAAFAYGDTHFQTFDGQIIHYQGTCSQGYTLFSSHCHKTNWNRFRITGYNMRRTENHVGTFLMKLKVSYSPFDIPEDMQVLADTRWPTLRYRIKNLDGTLSGAKPLSAGSNYPRYNIAVRGRANAWIVYFGVTSFVEDPTTSELIKGNYEFSVRYTGHSVFNIRIEASCQLKDQVCGILGNNNGEPGDDLRYVDETGEEYDAWIDDGNSDLHDVFRLIGDHWRNDKECETGDSTKIFVPESECGTDETLADAHKYCDEAMSMLLDTDPALTSLCGHSDNIRDTYLVRASVYKACVYDLCAHHNTTEDWPFLLCNIGKVVQLQCGKTPLAENWMTQNLVQPTTAEIVCQQYELPDQTENCPVNSEPTDCVERSACTSFNIWDCHELRATFDNAAALTEAFNTPCTEATYCTPGCRCKAEFIWNGFECITFDEYCPNLNPSRDTDVQCLLSGMVFGDPHYRQYGTYTDEGTSSIEMHPTFDFQGDCTYTISKSINMGNGNFHIWSTNEHRDGVLETTWLRSTTIEIDADGENFKFTYDKHQFGFSVSINNRNYTLVDADASFANGKILIRKVKPGYNALYFIENALSALDNSQDPNQFNLRVLVGGSTLTIEPSCDYHNKLRGLLGTGDTNSTESLIMPDENIAGSFDEFANSWRIDSQTSQECTLVTTTPTIDHFDTCDKSAAELICLDKLAEGKVSCGNMGQFISQCIYDVCSATTEAKKIIYACEMAEVVANECERLMYYRKNWRTDVICDNTCALIDENMIYEERRPSCIKTTENCNDFPVDLPRFGCDDPIPQTGCFCDETNGWFWDPVMQRCDNECPPLQQVCDENNPFYGWTNTAGDPHYRTFDGAQIDFQGECRYTAMKKCVEDDSLPDFNVIVDTRHRDNNIVTHVYAVQIQYKPVGYDEYIRINMLLSRSSFKVSSSPLAAFETIESGMNLEDHGIAFRGRPHGSLQVYFGLDTSSNSWHDAENLSEENYLFTIKFGNYAASAKASCVLMDKICGLWGNFNGIRGDDLRDKNNVDPYRQLGMLDSHELMNFIGNSWIAEGQDNCLVEKDIPELLDCSQDSLSEAKETCETAWNIVKDNYNSGNCDMPRRKPKYMQACIYDLCQYTHKDNYQIQFWPDLVCDIIESVSGFCWGNDTPLDDWRSHNDTTSSVRLDICSRSCPKNMHFSTCMGAQNCRDKYTCQTITDLTNCPEIEPTSCSDGCVCDIGYFWDGRRCIKDSKCPAEPPSRNTDLSCFLNTAHVIGDPHYKTFDGDQIEFQGECWYTASKICDAKLAEANGLNLTNYEYQVKTKDLHDNGVSWVSKAKLILDIGEIIYTEGQPKLLAKIGGETYTLKRNGNYENWRIVTRSSSYRVFEVYVGVPESYFKTGDNYRDLTVHPEEYDLKWTADDDSWQQFQVRCAYTDLMCGIFGRGDGIINNDFFTPDGTDLNKESMLQADLDKFGHSWKVDKDGTCEQPTSPPFCDSTTHNQTFIDMIEAECDKYIINPLTPLPGQSSPDCDDAIREESYRVCLYDLCYTPEDEWELYGCQMTSRTAKMCSNEGFDTIGWREQSFCGLPECDTNQQFYPITGGDTDITSCDIRTTANCNDDLTCSSTELVEGCHCDEGYYWDDVANMCINYCPEPTPLCDVDAPYFKTGRAFGDPHYQTFDGQQISYQGGCTYILATTECQSKTLPLDDDQSSFEIIADQKHFWDNRRGTFIQGFTMTVDSNIQIQMRQGWPQFRVRSILTHTEDSQFLPVAFNTELEGYNIRFEGRSKDAKIILTKSLVEVIWNNKQITVQLPCTYKEKVCGLLGNFNGQLDDLNHLDGADPYSLGFYGNIDENERFFHWGESFKAENSTQICESDIPENTVKKCGKHKLTEYKSKCKSWIKEVLSDSYDPRNCEDKINSLMFIQACAYDLCQFDDQPEHESNIKCTTLDAVDSWCRYEHLSLGDWRSDSDLNCPWNCPVNSHYTTDVNNCLTSFNCQTGSCTPGDIISSGCDCDEGFYFDGIDCAPLEHCPPESPGDSVPIKCLLPAAFAFPAAGRNIQRPDAQFLQFDQNTIHIEGNCEYLLATSKCYNSDDDETNNLLDFELSFGRPHSLRNLTYVSLKLWYENPAYEVTIMYRPERNRHLWISLKGGDENKLDIVNEELAIVRRGHKVYLNVKDAFTTSFDNAPDFYDLAVDFDKISIELDCKYQGEVCGIGVVKIMPYVIF